MQREGGTGRTGFGCALVVLVFGGNVVLRTAVCGHRKIYPSLGDVVAGRRLACDLTGVRGLMECLTMPTIYILREVEKGEIDSQGIYLLTYLNCFVAIYVVLSLGLMLSNHVYLSIVPTYPPNI